MGTALSLMELARLEQHISDMVQATVNLVPESAIRPDLRDRVLAEAVPL